MCLHSQITSKLFLYMKITKDKKEMPRKRPGLKSEDTFRMKETLKSFKKLKNGKSFQCKKCGVKLNSQASLPMHLRRHEGVKRFSCPKCEAKFYSKGDMNRHIKSHLGLSEFQCHECDKKYTRKFFLKRHIQKVHLGVNIQLQVTNYKKPKPCVTCGKYVHPDSLRNHKRIHTAEKPYFCLRCLSSYCDPSSLRQHMAFHVKKRQVFCRTCQEIFDGDSELRAHVTLLHGGKNHYHLFSKKEIDKMKCKINRKQNSRRKREVHLSLNLRSAKKHETENQNEQKSQNKVEETSAIVLTNFIKSEAVDELEYCIEDEEYSVDSFFDDDFQDVEVKAEFFE